MSVASDLTRPFKPGGSLSRSNWRRMRRSPYPLLRGQNSTARTMAQTMPQPIQVMVGRAACHSRIFLCVAIVEWSLLWTAPILARAASYCPANRDVPAIAAGTRCLSLRLPAVMRCPAASGMNNFAHLNGPHTRRNANRTHHRCCRLSTLSLGHGRTFGQWGACT